MKSFGPILQSLRLSKGLVVRELAVKSGIDPALISKFETGKRFPNEDHIRVLSRALEVPFAELKKKWKVEQVMYLIVEEEDALEILQLAESRTEYLLSERALKLQGLSVSITEKLKRIDQLKNRWHQIKPKNSLQTEKMSEYFNVAYTYESNRIEGNTLTLSETQLVIREGLTIGGKSMREHLEAINHYEAIEFIEELVQTAQELSPRSLSQLHYLILKGIDKENAGRYRKVPVRISGSQHVPPQPFQIEKMMEDYFIHFENQKNSMHPVLLAAEMHERLVTIHPFIDGNGRTSRLVMNMLLLKGGYTLANLKGDSESRLRYYKALESVQIHNDPEPFYHLVMDCVESSLLEHLDLAGAI